VRAQTHNTELKLGSQFYVRHSPRSYDLCFRYDRVIKMRNNLRLFL